MKRVLFFGCFLCRPSCFYFVSTLRSFDIICQHVLRNAACLGHVAWPYQYRWVGGQWWINTTSITAPTSLSLNIITVISFTVYRFTNPYAEGLLTHLKYGNMTSCLWPCPCFKVFYLLYLLSIYLPENSYICDIHMVTIEEHFLPQSGTEKSINIALISRFSSIMHTWFLFPWVMAAER